jgi:hypothetical protein
MLHLRQRGLSSSSIPFSSQNLNVLPFHILRMADSLIVYGNDMSSRQIFHAALVETPICCAECSTFLPGFLFIASRAAPTNVSVRTDALSLRPFARLSHTYSSFKLFNNLV